MTHAPWFRPMRYGYGAVPLNWKGWACLAVVAAGIYGLVWLVSQAVEAGVAFAIPWFVLLALAAYWLVWVVRKKTAGEWRWRWWEE